MHHVVPVAVLIGALALRVVTPGFYRHLVTEDGIIEWATAAVYLGAAAFTIAIVRRLRRTEYRAFWVPYLLLGIGFVFVAGEEISWGQRQLDFTGPDALVERNIQSESNLHNTLSERWLHGTYIAVGLYAGLLSRWIAPFLVGKHRAWLIAPAAALALYFLVPAAVYVYFDYLDPIIRAVLGDDYGWRQLRLGNMQEVAELVLGIGFLLFVRSVLTRVRNPASAVT